MEFIKRILAAFFDFLQSIVVVMAIMVMIYLFVMSPQEINGASMEPNFHNGEYILTNKIWYKFKDPQRGEVIIFKSPRNKEVDYIKRIIGIPGDRVRLADNTFYVNDQKVEEAYIPEGTPIFPGSFLQESSEIIVPENQYFVIGDNRPHSADSREFGPIPFEDIIGKAFVRYWPFNRAGVIYHAIYNLQ